MSYHIELRPGQSVIWETWGADYDPGVETEPALLDEMHLLETAGRPVVLVVDIRAVDLTFNDILYLANAGFPPEQMRHPNYRGGIIVSTDEVVAASAKGLKNETFGYVKLRIVASPDEALALARQAVAWAS